MVGNEFAFSVAIRDPGRIRNLKLRCDCTNEIEISGILKIDEMVLVEDSVLRIAGKFGEVDLSVTRSELEKILEGENK